MPKMKDSSNSWIGDIPDNWDVYRFKEIANLYTGNSIKDDQKQYYEDSENARPYISSKDIDSIYGSINYENGMYIKYDDTFFRIAPKGSSLMCIEGGSAGKKKSYVNQDVSFVNKLCCFKANNKVTDKYLYYYINNPAYEDEFALNITGMIGGVSVSTLKNLKICIPPILEQKRITMFLDSKCSEIDILHANIEKQIETLEEYKKSVITEAVTKGLDPNVEMKDSGIEWIGKINKNYQIARLGLFSFVTKLSGFEYTDVMSNTIGNDLDVPIVRAQNVRMFKSKFDNITEFIDYDTSKKLDRCSLNKKCVLITFIGAGIGDVCIFNEAKRFHLAPNVAKIEITKKDRLLEEYVMYYLGSYAGIGEINKISKASAQPSLSMETIRGIKVILPSLFEQCEIVNYINSKCMEIDWVIQEKKQQLATLEQYKKSLIYEYVTGKKEVPAS